jgi:hypothetical protein
MQESVIVLVQTGYSLGVAGGGVILPPTTVGLAAVPSGAAGLRGTLGSAGTMPLASGGTGAGGTFALGSDGGVAGGVAGGTASGAVAGGDAGGSVSGGAVIGAGGAVSDGGAGTTCAKAGTAAPARSMAGSMNRFFISTFLPIAPLFQQSDT